MANTTIDWVNDCRPHSLTPWDAYWRPGTGAFAVVDTVTVGGMAGAVVVRHLDGTSATYPPDVWVRLAMWGDPPTPGSV